MSSKISVIIPCYNAARYLPETLESLAQQSYQNFEVIVVNDASTNPDTLEYLKLLTTSPPLPNLTVYHHPSNRGLAETRNTGIQRARGEFIQLLDADDLIDPKKFETQVENFENHPETDIVLSDYLFFNSDRSRFFEDETHTKIRTSQFSLENFLYDWERGLCVPIHCGLFRKTVFDSNLFSLGMRAKEDWVFWAETAKRNKKFFFNGYRHAFYRLHDSNMCKSTENMVVAMLKASLLLSEKVDNAKDRSRFMDHITTHIQQNYLFPYRDELLLNFESKLRQEEVFLFAFKVSQLSKKYTKLNSMIESSFYLIRSFWVILKKIVKSKPSTHRKTS